MRGFVFGGSVLYFFLVFLEVMFPCEALQFHFLQHLQDLPSIIWVEQQPQLPPHQQAFP